MIFSDLEKNEQKYLIIEFILLVIFGVILSYFISEALKPQTDISVNCKFYKSINSNNTLNVSFTNNADFGSRGFYIYIWGITSGGWVNSYVVSDQCERIMNQSIDMTDRFKIYCKFIPPKSTFEFNIYADLKTNTTSEDVIIQWWGESSPLKEIMDCISV